jgi:protein disulfide-isomerase A1
MVGLLLCIFAIANSDITEEDDVLVLNDANFNEALQIYPQILVEFYAPWCQFCQKFAPMYAKAARTLKNENGIRIAKFDATKNLETALKYHIEGYPTLKFFQIETPTEYTGIKSEIGIVNWVLKKMGPPTKTINDSVLMNEYLKKNELAIVLFSKDPEVISNFEKVAKNTEGNYFIVSQTDQVMQEYNIKQSEIVVFRNAEPAKNKFSGSFSQGEISKFIESSLIPWVMPFNEKAIQIVFGKQNPCLFLFRKDSEDTIYSRILQNTANLLKGSILISYTDLSSSTSKRLVEFLGFPQSWMPFAIIVDEKLQKYVMRSEITEASLIQFVENWRTGKQKPYFKSQPVPSASYEGNVRIVVGENFDEVVLDRKFDVLVEFYAPWCGHCKKLAPEYSKLASKLKEYDTLVIAKIDATENEIEGFDIQEFPTLKFFPANNKEGINYSGKKDCESLEQFIRANAALPIKRKDL